METSIDFISQIAFNIAMGHANKQNINKSNANYQQMKQRRKWSKCP